MSIMDVLGRIQGFERNESTRRASVEDRDHSMEDEGALRAKARVSCPGAKGFLATMAEGSHPIPSRTRKLSPPAPMVLQGSLCGRVGRCQIYGPDPVGSGPSFFLSGGRAERSTQRGLYRFMQRFYAPLVATAVFIGICACGADAQPGAASIHAVPLQKAPLEHKAGIRTPGGTQEWNSPTSPKAPGGTQEWNSPTSPKLPGSTQEWNSPTSPKESQ
jgi:hypothetical protein